MGAVSGSAIGAGLGGAALTGGVLGLMGRDKNKTISSTQTSAPWSAQVPYLKEIFKRAQDYGNTPREYYDFNTYASPDSATLEGLDRQYNRALEGSPLYNEAREQNLATISGDYLSPDSNPALQDTIDAANDSVLRSYRNSVIPGLQSAFSGAGRYGSGMQQIAEQEAANDLTKRLSRNATNIAFNNYNNERNRQVNAISSAPAFAQADYADIGQLLDVGAQREAIDQQGIDEQMNRFDFNQDEPLSRLNNYRGLVSGDYGGTTTSTGRNPNYKSRTSALLGGMMGGLGVGTSLLSPMSGPGMGGMGMRQPQPRFY